MQIGMECPVEEYGGQRAGRRLSGRTLLKATSPCGKAADERVLVPLKPPRSGTEYAEILESRGLISGGIFLTPSTRKQEEKGMMFIPTSPFDRDLNGIMRKRASH